MGWAMGNWILDFLKWTAFVVVGYSLIGDGDKTVITVLMAVITTVAVLGFYKERTKK
jgi:hypothetical protein